MPAVGDFLVYFSVFYAFVSYLLFRVVSHVFGHPRNSNDELRGEMCRLNHAHCFFRGCYPTDMWEKAISLTAHGEVECQHVLVIAVHSSARDVQACDEGLNASFEPAWRPCTARAWQHIAASFRVIPFGWNWSCSRENMTTTISAVPPHCRGEFERPYSELSPWRLRRRSLLIL